MTTSTPSQTAKVSTLDILWAFYQSQSKRVRKAFLKRIEEEETEMKTKAQQAIVKDSLTRAFDELYSGEVHHDARKLFAK